MSEIKASKPDGKTQPGHVVTVMPFTPVGSLAQTLKTSGGSTSAAVASVATLVSTSSDATQAQYLLESQFLRNYGGGTLT